MKILSKLLLIAILALLGNTTLYAERINMKEAGADTNGNHPKLNARLIKEKIKHLEKEGGGTLYFPAGTYMTGPIELKSNMTIELEAGAILKFSDDFDLYLPYIEVRHEGVMMKSFQPLIYARDAENITIKGEGTLDGQGKGWWDEFFKVYIDLRDNGKRTVNKYQTMFDEANDVGAIRAEVNEDWHGTLDRRFFRPPFIQMLHCKDIRIEGVKIINSPFWTINPQFCDNIFVRGVTLVNPPSPNTDGINPESCRNVHISDCHISVGDDCITIKAGRDAQARNIAVPCENITITNCTMLSGHGGVVIGSEMSGSVRRVTISNCVFDGTDRGIRLKSTRGRGGVVEDIRVSNIVMYNIKREALVFNLKYSKMPEEAMSERTPVFRNIFVSGVSVRNVNTPIKIVGLEEAPITDIVLRDIFVQDAKQPCIFEDCKDVVLDDVFVDGKKITL